MDIIFRNAIAISVLVHSALFAPFLRLDAAKFDPALKKPIEIDYVRIQEPEPEPVKPEIEIPETPKVDIAKKVEVKPAEPVPAAKPAENAPKEVPLEDAKKQAEIKSTKDYVNYYHLIREKIRKRLKSNYRAHLNEGEVSLAFRLASDGGLIDVSVIETGSAGNAALADVATRSLREASPFPKFPKALSLPEMSFDLTVTFKRR